MVSVAVKINKDLHKEIVKLIQKPNYKYKYGSISAFINEAAYEKLKLDKSEVKFFKIRLP